MDNLQTLTTMGTRNIGPRQAHKKLPHQNAEKTNQMTNMDPTKTTTGEHRYLISFDFELICSRLFQKRVVHTKFDIYFYIRIQYHDS
jgi:hypothetical protein